MASEAPVLGTRAVVRTIEPGNSMACTGCSQPVKFRAGKRGKRVIANVYDHGVWDRVEHWHLICYTDAGQPHGTVA